MLDSILKRAALKIPAVRKLHDELRARRTEIQLGLDAAQAKLNVPNNLYVPTEVFFDTQNTEYMEHPYPVASDFYHPKFKDFLKRYNNHKFQMHRKLWEFAYVEHMLQSSGVIKADNRGLCFGVGQEPLPALLAAQGCYITATDAPAEIIGEKWVGSKEFSPAVSDLNYKGMISATEFNRLVSYQTCDMNHISSSLVDYDFCWSACCLEHLGSLQHGFDFILNSLGTLKVGGVACHTTELNLSSNTHTVETGGTVLYRRSDLEAFVSLVKDMGHEISPIVISPFASPMDHHVDVPPYSHNPHLKLLLENYVTTSIGIVIRKGR